MAEVAAPAIARQRKIDSGEIGQEVLREQEDFANDRAPWEPSWQDITERILPNYADFTSKSSPGQRRTDKIYDGTGPLALERFQAAMESYLAPRTQTWHKGRCGVRQVADEKDVKVWADEVSKTLIDYRYNPRSGFAIGLPEIFTGLGALGTACLFTELDRAGGGPRYRSIPLVEIFISNGKDGRCDKLHRRFEYTARQAAQAWGEDNLPDKIRAQLSDKPETKSEYVHCVKPRGDYRPFSRRAADAPFLSTYVSVDAKQAIGQGGFFEFPYHVSRYTTSPREKYGRSPAFLVLSDIKMVNEMSRDQIRILNRLADPPLLVFDDGVIEKISTKPAALNFGGVNEQGQPLVHAMQFGGNPTAIDAELGQRRNLINTAFLVTLFQILIEHPRMSATEVLERAKEKGALLAPTAGRQLTELLDPMLRREYRMLARVGALPPPPQKVLDALKGGDGIWRPIADDVWVPVFDNQLTRAARAEEAAGLLRTLEILSPAAQIDPSVLDIFDFDEAGRGIAEINAVNPKWLRSPEEVQALRDGRAQAGQAEKLLTAAPVIAQALERVSNAQLNAAQARA